MKLQQPATSYGPENCDKEPIHIPGSVQPFGFLLAFRLRDTEILYASANADVLFGRPVGALLNDAAATVLGEDILHSIGNTLASGSARDQRERVGTFAIGPHPRVDVFAHINVAGFVIAEFEIAEPAAAHTNRAAPIDLARMSLARAATAQSLDQLMEIAVVGLKTICNYNRVKGYRYLSDGSGEVVSEARDQNVDSFLGLRYPAWDVPKQARALQVRCPLRMLCDVRQDPVPLLARPGVEEDLDLSLAQLRGISPIHVEYLQNMGVAATLTIGLVVDGALWGMLSCHHLSPRVLPPDARVACEIFGQMLSLLIKERLQKNDTDAKLRASNARQRILAETDAVRDLTADFDRVAPILADVVESDGLAIVSGADVFRYASCPADDIVRALARHRADEDDLLAVTESLRAARWIAPEASPNHSNPDDPNPDSSNADGSSAEDPDIYGSTAGCLLVRTPAARPLNLIFFRDATVTNINWAGRPMKRLEDSAFGPRVSPRKSFERYFEEHRHASEPWEGDDLVAAGELQTMLTQIALRNNRAVLETHTATMKYQRQQDLLIAELNHRVRNILALIRSVSRQAKESSNSLESYARALEQRIAALAAAHDLAVDGTMKGVALRNLLDTEIAPYHQYQNGQVLLAGEPVGLRADVAPIVALVVHEMVTNAAKYGALSTSDGLIRMRWRHDAEGIQFNWQELGGPPVSPPTRAGFGRSLIEKAIPYEFGGTADLEFAASGVTFSFTLPAEFVVELADDARDNTLPIAGPITDIPRPASGKSALLVEDNLVLSMDMAQSLTRLGADEVITAASVAEARRKLNGRRVDFAVLDMNLRGDFSFDLALGFLDEGLPFLFASGYGSSTRLPHALSGCTVLAKPVDDISLAHAIAAILNGGE